MKKRVKIAEKQNKFIIFIACLLIVYTFAGIGSFFTAKETSNTWYQNIKPAITPPNWVFPIVWNILFFLIAVSLFLAWTNSKSRAEKQQIALVFAINLTLNALWSFLFFGLRNPLAGFIDILLIDFSIVIMILAVRKISKASAYFLVPYLLWVCFATIINFLAV